MKRVCEAPPLRGLVVILRSAAPRALALREVADRLAAHYLVPRSDSGGINMRNLSGYASNFAAWFRWVEQEAPAADKAQYPWGLCPRLFLSLRGCEGGADDDDDADGSDGDLSFRSRGRSAAQRVWGLQRATTSNGAASSTSGLPSSCRRARRPSTRSSASSHLAAPRASRSPTWRSGCGRCSICPAKVQPVAPPYIAACPYAFTISVIRVEGKRVDVVRARAPAAAAAGAATRDAVQDGDGGGHHLGSSFGSDKYCGAGGGLAADVARSNVSSLQSERHRPSPPRTAATLGLRACSDHRSTSASDHTACTEHELPRLPIDNSSERGSGQVRLRRRLRRPRISPPSPTTPSAARSA